MSIEKDEAPTWSEDVRHLVHPDADVVDPDDDSYRGPHKIKPASQISGQTQRIGTSPFYIHSASVSELSCFPQSHVREVDADYPRPPARERDRIKAEVTLEMQYVAARDVLEVREPKRVFLFRNQRAAAAHK